MRSPPLRRPGTHGIWPPICPYLHLLHCIFHSSFSPMTHQWNHTVTSHNVKMSHHWPEFYIWPPKSEWECASREKRLPFNFPILILGIWGWSQRGRTFYPKEYTSSVTMIVKGPFVVKTKWHCHWVPIECWSTVVTIQYCHWVPIEPYEPYVEHCWTL